MGMGVAMTVADLGFGRGEEERVTERHRTSIDYG
jgi:hypothetical protein